MVHERLEIQITQQDHRRRLEDFLCDHFNGLSKMYLREVVKNEQCQVNGRFENRGYRVRANDFLELEIDLTRETAMRPENVPIDVIFEDNALIVVNKPAGMLVHPSFRDRNGTLLNALAFYLNRDVAVRTETEPREAFIRPGLIHRLDKMTSGLLVVAKTPHAHRVLSDHFGRKLIDKRYLALVDGIVETESGTIVAPIGRYPELKYWGVKEDGKYSETRYWVRERYADKTLLELEPVTGRTNQLRIHCEHIGHPITGDTHRGASVFPRLCLHAWKLSFGHPSGGGKMQFEAPVSFTDEIGSFQL